MNKKEIAENLVELLGGRDNIKDVSNCFTRVRFEVVESKKINVLAIREDRNIVASYFDEESVELVLNGLYTEDIAKICVDELGCKSSTGILEFEKSFEDTDESVISDSLESSISNLFNSFYKAV